MRIEHATLVDAPMMELLWQVAFDDDEADIRSFLYRFLETDTAWVARDDGMIVSMLFVLKASLVIGADAWPIGYIYAGATLPSHRGKGYYRCLLKKAEQDALARGFTALFLQPADETLAATYERLGFTVPLYTRASQGCVCSETTTWMSPEQYAERRTDMLMQKGAPFVQWPLAVYRQWMDWGVRLGIQNGLLTATASDGAVLEQVEAPAHLCERAVGRLKPLNGRRYDQNNRIYMGYGMD